MVMMQRMKGKIQPDGYYECGREGVSKNEKHEHPRLPVLMQVPKCMRNKNIATRT
jgi:hypothetical protein